MKESGSLQETPLCGSSEELPVEMHGGKTRAALGQTRQQQRVLQSAAGRSSILPALYCLTHGAERGPSRASKAAATSLPVPLSIRTEHCGAEVTPSACMVLRRRETTCARGFKSPVTLQAFPFPTSPLRASALAAMQFCCTAIPAPTQLGAPGGLAWRNPPQLLCTRKPAEPTSTTNKTATLRSTEGG